MTKPGQDVINWYSDLDPGTQGALTDYYNEIEFDVFAKDPLFQTVFAQGNWGKIEDATFETFAEVKTYVEDTIFATEHQKTYEEGEYVPTVDRSVGDDPIYVDVSEYMDPSNPKAIDRSLPQIYQRPDPVAMPHSMLKYSSRAKLPQFADAELTKGWDFFWQRPEGTTKRKAEEWGQDGKQVTPGWIDGNIDTLGDYQKHLDQVKADRIEAGKADYVKLLEDNQKRADEIWARRTTLEGERPQDKYGLNTVEFGRYEDELEPLFEEVIGSDDKEDIQAWMAMAQVKDLTYENYKDEDGEELMEEGGSLDRVKFVYDFYGGKIPTREEFEVTKGDALIEWEKDKGKSWRKEND